MTSSLLSVAFRNAAYSPGSNTTFTFDYDTVKINEGNCFDIANNWYLVSAAGYYMVSAGFVFLNTSNNKPGYAVDIEARNTANTATVHSTRLVQTQSVDPGTYFSSSGVAFFKLDVGQKIRVRFTSFGHNSNPLDFFPTSAASPILFNYVQVMRLQDYFAYEPSFLYPT